MTFEFWLPLIIVASGGSYLVWFLWGTSDRDGALGDTYATPLLYFAGALIVFVFGLLPQFKMKRAELVLRCHEIHSEHLKMAYASDEPTQHEDPEAFYTRFWYIQSAQFAMWRGGLIPSSTFTHWMAMRVITYIEDPVYRGWRYRASWVHARGLLRGTDFAVFMDAVFEAVVPQKVVFERAIGKRKNYSVAADAGIHGVRDHEVLDPEVLAEHFAADRYALDEVHLKIQRLMLYAGGNIIGFILFVRWFSWHHRDLTRTPKEALLDYSTKAPLWEQCRYWIPRWN